jgi:hypothetical protein
MVDNLILIVFSYFKDFDKACKAKMCLKARAVSICAGTSIKRGGLGGSVKCLKSNLQPLFQVGYLKEFDEHSTKHPHTKFQTQILMNGKAAALGSLLHTLL